MNRTSSMRLINLSVAVNEFPNPVAYDPKYKKCSGYYLCKVCKNRFPVGRGREHKDSCTLIEEKSWSVFPKGENYVYVVGPRESYDNTPLLDTQVPKMKSIIEEWFV